MLKPKSGRERKAKRGARKKTEKELPTHWQPQTEKEAQQNNKLVAQALRWNTEATHSDFAKSNPQDLSAKALALLITRRNMLSPDSKVANTAITNLIAMEKQNQADQKPTDSTNHNHLHLHAEGELANATNNELLDVKQVLFQVRNSQCAKPKRN